jgi:hypothetical protein
MNRLKIIFSCISVCILLYACKEIPVEIGEVIIPDSGKTVLIEDLTGASCPNCPKGISAVNNILDKYKNKVYAVGIHGFFLSNPTPKSKFDFRNPHARDLENWFRPTGGKPAASINRVRRPDNSLLSYLPDLWLSLTEAELQKAQQIELAIELSYNTESRQADIKVTAIPLTDLNGDFNISVFLTESNIIDAQSNGTEIIENFRHDHVLRTMLTKFDGDSFTSSMKRGVSVSRNYSFTLPVQPAGLWIPDNMHVVAMIAHNSSDNREVIQVIEKHLK